MNIDELIQLYPKNDIFSFQEVVQKSLSDWLFYPVCLFIIFIFLICYAFFIILPLACGENSISEKTVIILLVAGLAICIPGGIASTFAFNKTFLVQDWNEEWNKKHVEAFLEEQEWNKEDVTKFTFKGKEIKEEKELFPTEENKKEKKPDLYIFHGFIRSVDGKVVEETFTAETLQEDLKKGEKPYIEFKYLPKTVNEQAKKGRYHIVFHIDGETLQTILE